MTQHTLNYRTPTLINSHINLQTTKTTTDKHFRFLFELVKAVVNVVNVIVVLSDTLKFLLGGRGGGGRDGGGSDIGGIVVVVIVVVVMV